MLKAKWTDNVKGQVTTGGGFPPAAIQVWTQQRGLLSRVLPYKVTINGDEAQEHIATEEIKAHFEAIRVEASNNWYQGSARGSPTNNQEAREAQAPEDVDFYDDW